MEPLQGTWGGQGTRKAPPKPHLIKKVAGIDSQSRADFGKAHVIISEKHDRKASKYLTKDLPYPYTSKAQFERTLEMPIGREWNTRIATQRATLPKVIKKVRYKFRDESHQDLTCLVRWGRSSDRWRNGSNPHVIHLSACFLLHITLFAKLKSLSQFRLRTNGFVHLRIHSIRPTLTRSAR